MIGQILLILGMAFAFGLERQYSHKPVGFGTFIFVGIGSTALGLVSVSFDGQNPLPLLGSIVTGIGFLGAGAMIKSGDKIFGVTTAASIWAFAIIGLLVGTGFTQLAIALYATMWVVIGIDWYLRVQNIGSYQKHLEMTVKGSWDQKPIAHVLAKYVSKFQLLDIKIDKEKEHITTIYLVQGHKEKLYALTAKLSGRSEIVKVSMF